MKRLLVLWDPHNPLTPVGPVLSALQEHAEASECTFQDVSHRTLPNRAFKIAPHVDRLKIDALLWIEGGPLPEDLAAVRCPKVCWLPSAHLEPTLLEEVGSAFDLSLTSNLDLCAEEKARWLPLSALPGGQTTPPQGISILMDDPKPPLHAALDQQLRPIVATLPRPSRPIVFCPGQEGQVNPLLFECMRSGAVVVVDPGSDLRGLAHVGEHLEVYPALGEMGSFARDLANDGSRLERLSARGPEIVEHLHTPRIRARQLADALWPRETRWGGQPVKPQVSILVMCYRYLRRFRFCLESLARQEMPPGSIEVVVADPESPDGLAQHLAEFSIRHPHVRVVRLPLDPRYHRNRGIGINRAFDASLGEVIVSIDGDLVFPPHLLNLLVEQVRRAPEHVYGIRRSFLSKDVTEQILEGRIDPFARFGELSLSEGDGEEMPFVGVLGYCQAVHRKAFARTRYPEEFDRVNQSDIVFIERLVTRADVHPEFLKDHTALHLWHPRNWKGTNEFL